VISILGAGPHGRQIAAILPYDHRLFDDFVDGYSSCTVGARWPWVVGAAWPHVRRQIAEAHNTDPWHRGNIIFPGAHLGNDVELGKHVHVQFNAVVTHGCRIGDYTTICPGAVLSGDVTVEDDVLIGANATVIHGGITIGRGARIGAGAVVLDHVPAGATVVGVPARKIA
jgi:acetyltransferase-like isoleucine patch superfamily enzyme